MIKLEGGDVALAGRAVFVVESTSAGVAIRTALLTIEGQIIPMVGIFPDRDYALEQIEQLKGLVVAHFEQMTPAEFV